METAGQLLCFVRFHRKKHLDDDANDGGYGRGAMHGDPEYYGDDANDAPRHFKQKPVGKVRPNFFIALKISDVRLNRKLKNAQSILMKELKNKIFERALIDESIFHITINAIYCDDDEEVFHLMNEFESFGKEKLQRLIPTKLSVRIHVNGLSHFRQKVVFGHIEDDAAKSKLENVYHALHTQLQNAGIIHQSHRFEAHLTIMKLSRIQNNKHLVVPLELIDKLNHKYNESLDFGYQYVNGLELLSMSDERDADDGNDYYQCISSIAPLKLR